MMRFRWALLLLISLVAVGVASSAVLARSNVTTTTYWNNVVHGSSPTAGDWLGYNQSMTWTFGVSELQAALPGSVSLNFSGLSKSIQTGGGAGYSTSMRIVATGAYAQTFTATLANPWRPHVAFNADEGVGWQAYATLNLPAALYRSVNTLTVKVTSLTSNTFMSLGENGLLIGYSTAG